MHISEYLPKPDAPHILKNPPVQTDWLELGEINIPSGQLGVGDFADLPKGQLEVIVEPGQYLVQVQIIDFGIDRRIACLRMLLLGTEATHQEFAGVIEVEQEPAGVYDMQVFSRLFKQHVKTRDDQFSWLRHRRGFLGRDIWGKTELDTNTNLIYADSGWGYGQYKVERCLSGEKSIGVEVHFIPHSIVEQPKFDDVVLKAALYHDFDVYLSCNSKKPTHDELGSMLVDYWTPKEDMTFDTLYDLGFSQVDDYWGISNSDNTKGDDIIVWLFPIIDGEEVYHNDGPFDGFRLSYSVLRNDPQHLPRFLESITRFTQALGATVEYPVRDLKMGHIPNLQIIEADALSIIEFWRGQGIEPGSTPALRMNF